MIPKEAFISIAAVMAVSCAFGYVLRGFIDRERKGGSEWFYDGSEADHDRWENDPEPTMMCDTCKWEVTSYRDSECSDCNDYDKWEAKE